MPMPASRATAPGARSRAASSIAAVQRSSAPSRKPARAAWSALIRPSPASAAASSCERWRPALSSAETKASSRSATTGRGAPTASSAQARLPSPACSTTPRPARRLAVHAGAQHRGDEVAGIAGKVGRGRDPGGGAGGEDRAGVALAAGPRSPRQSSRIAPIRSATSRPTQAVRSRAPTEPATSAGSVSSSIRL